MLSNTYSFGNLEVGQLAHNRIEHQIFYFFLQLLQLLLVLDHHTLELFLVDSILQQDQVLLLLVDC